jgi:hypothetical protein
MTELTYTYYYSEEITLDVYYDYEEAFIGSYNEEPYGMKIEITKILNEDIDIMEIMDDAIIASIKSELELYHC